MVRLRKSTTKYYHISVVLFGERSRKHEQMNTVAFKMQDEYTKDAL